jgi:hypothetical protein
VDCLFISLGSGKPFHPNKQHEQFTLPEREPSLLYSRMKFTRFREMRIRADSSIFKSIFYFSGQSEQPALFGTGRLSLYHTQKIYESSTGKNTVFLYENNQNMQFF